MHKWGNCKRKLVFSTESKTLSWSTHAKDEKQPFVRVRSRGTNGRKHQLSSPVTIISATETGFSLEW